VVLLHRSNKRRLIPENVVVCRYLVRLHAPRRAPKQKTIHGRAVGARHVFFLLASIRVAFLLDQEHRRDRTPTPTRACSLRCAALPRHASRRAPLRSRLVATPGPWIFLRPAETTISRASMHGSRAETPPRSSRSLADDGRGTGAKQWAGAQLTTQ
jgi:hypothetical protein